jgi:hypothetical protein
MPTANPHILIEMTDELPDPRGWFIKAAEAQAVRLNDSHFGSRTSILPV